MKSPQALVDILRRQWENADRREARLLPHEDAWPLRLPIGAPSARAVAEAIESVREHIRAWAAVRVGQVEWQARSYRATGEAIEIPVAWRLDRPSDWVAACDSPEIRSECETLGELCARTPPEDHRLWVRKRHLWRSQPANEIIRASRLADILEPGCAEGRPLRALGHAGTDTKFYERHRALLLQLLDLRHDGAASEQGLEVFLDAEPEGAHWLLLADLDGGLLPFRRQRVRTTDLAEHPGLPGTHLIVVENERALHHLPDLHGTLAILGAGNNLAWLAAPWIDRKHLAYWGDLDTWGLCLLARARRTRPQLEAVLMDASTFFENADKYAVAEPKPADIPNRGLTPAERDLFDKLESLQNGRLEQEFLPAPKVRDAIRRWVDDGPSATRLTAVPRPSS